MTILNDLDRINEIDTKDMYHNIIHMPEMVLMAYELKISQEMKIIEVETGSLNRVVILGNGTASLSGEIIKSAFDKKLAIEIVTGFELPYLDKRTLVILLDYYGTDENAIAAVSMLKNSAAQVAVITSRTELLELSKIDYPNLIIPDDLSSRSAIAYNVISIIKFLEAYKLIPNQAGVVVKTIANLINKAGAIAKVVPDSKNFAKSSAMRLQGKIPMIYACSPELKPLAKRWKQQFNNNSKIPAFGNGLPDIISNEVEGWDCSDLNQNFIPIIINDFTMDAKYRGAVTEFKSYLNKKEIEFMEFFVEGESTIEKIFSLIYLGDMLTFYLGILNGKNPGSNCFAEYMKEKKEN